MSDINTEVHEAAEKAANAIEEAGTDFNERFTTVVGKVNESLNQVDWSKLGTIGKIIGIFAAVIIAQILIKGILDTINLLPIVPGLLELFGLVIVGTWSWQNLTTNEKRSEVLAKVQQLKQEYLG